MPHYRIQCASRDEAEAVQFAVAAVDGHPATGTRIGAGHSGERIATGTLVEGNVVPDGNRWYYETDLGPLGRILQRSSESYDLTSRSWRTVPGNGALFPNLSGTEGAIWDSLTGFVRENLYDLDKQLRWDLLEIEGDAPGAPRVVRSLAQLPGPPPMTGTAPHRYQLPIRQAAPGEGERRFVLFIARTQWEAYPRLRDRPDLDAIFASFPEAFLFTLCVTLLGTHRVGQLEYEEFRALRLRTCAARAFVSAACHAFCAAPRDFHLFNALNDVSVAPYEGRANTGALAFFDCSRDLPWSVRFEVPVALKDTRRLRKLLEMSDEALVLGSDSVAVFGLLPRGDLPDAHYMARFLPFGRWTFDGPEPLLETIEGEPRIPRPAFDEGQLREKIASYDGCEAILRLAREAVKQRHGTIVIVSDVAPEEARRIASAFPVAPRVLDDLSARRVTTIDGAVLVGPNGMCYAVGVILDGLAAPGVGEPGRGARYNSALRYLESQHDPRNWNGRVRHCTAIVVSEDGDVDVLPRPQRLWRPASD